MPRRHAGLALVVAVCWAVNFVVIEIGLESFPPLLFAALRFGLVALPAVFFVPRPDVRWTVVVAVGLFICVGQFGLLLRTTRGHDPRSSRSGRRRGIHQRRRLAWQTRTPAAKRRPGERPRVVPADRRAPPASSGRERKKLDEAVIPSLRRTAQHSTRRWLDARSPLAIGGCRRMDGAFMEPSGRNRWQIGRARKPLKQADPQPVATHGNRFAAHGKEGVDGSSPSEGSACSAA